MCAVYYREWEDEREELRLKRVLNWLFSGDKKSKKTERAECSHEHFERLPNGELKCRDCGEVGN